MEDQVLVKKDRVDRNAKNPSAAFLAKVSLNREDRSGGIADLDLEIAELRENLELTTHDPTRASHFQRLGTAYYYRYRRSREDSDFERAIENHQAALALTPRDDSSRIEILSCLADTFHDRGLWSRESIYIDKCIELLEGYRTQMGPQYLLPSHSHNLLAAAYCARFIILSEDDEDLNRSIHLFKQLLDLLPSSDLACQFIFQTLGRLYGFRYEKIGKQEDLETSVQFLQKALDALVDGDAKDDDRAETLGNLGDAFAMKYHHSRNLDDLESCIRLQEEALSILPDELPPSDRYLLMSLSFAYELRFEALNSIVDLDIAIRILQKSLSFIEDDTRTESWGMFQLGTVYQKRYRRTKKQPDFNKAISCSQKARDLVPHDGHLSIRALTTMGLAFHDRYKMLGNDEDIEESIYKTTEALHLAQGRYKSFQYGLSETLAESYISKYQRTERIEDLETAIGYGHKAVDSLSKDDHYYPASLLGLGKIYSKMSDRTEEEEDYKATMETLQKALDLTPKDHPLWSQLMYLLAHEYWQRFDRQKNSSDLDIALEMQEQAFDHNHSPALERIKAGSALTFWLLDTGRIPAAYQIVIKTLSLLSQLASRSLMVSDKQMVLKTIADCNIPSTAASIALVAGKGSYKAIQHLEFGRSIIVGALSDLRINTYELRLSHPHLAEEFIQLADQLDAEADLVDGFSNPRYMAAQKLDSTIEHIQKLSGFDRFLEAPSEKELMNAAARGPIVVVNLIYYRSDALIIQKDQISSLELPDLYDFDATHHAMKPSIGQDTLEWLWDTAAGPILKTLGIVGPPASPPWPRVTWILTGPLSTLPIHAAGYHYPGSVDTVIDRVISSYSSSVRALILSQQNATESLTSRQVGKSVLVGVQELRYASEEIKALEQLCAEMNLQTNRTKPCREDVLSSLADCEIFHFAGHGKTDSHDPTKSSLKMNDAPVTVQDLFNLKIHERAPFLAYLSACSTGLTGDSQLVDEGLHLIGACQLAGFRNVIGTLRIVDDGLCFQVAKKTYEWIRDCNLSDESVGEGLHHAVRSLRDQWLTDEDEKETFQDNLDKEEPGRDRAKPITGVGQDKNARESRDIFECDNTSTYWALFVYFGI